MSSPCPIGTVNGREELSTCVERKELNGTLYPQPASKGITLSQCQPANSDPSGVPQDAAQFVCDDAAKYLQLRNMAISV
jgi:hypothetical protein